MALDDEAFLKQQSTTPGHALVLIQVIQAHAGGDAVRRADREQESTRRCRFGGRVERLRLKVHRRRGRDYLQVHRLVRSSVR